MADPPISRSAALKALKGLINTNRPSPNDSPGDVFPFGILPSGYLDGNSKQRPIKEHRAIVLMTATVLDQALQGAILTKLPAIIPNNESYIFNDEGAPLRDFDAKIRMGFALGLYGQGARADLSLIRNIRNVFAHSRLNVSFENKEVSDACQFFTLTERVPNAISRKDDACETFISVGWEYSLQLITYERVADKAGRSLRILDLPASPEKSK